MPDAQNPNAMLQAGMGGAATIGAIGNQITFVFPDGTTRNLTLPRYLAMPVGDVGTTLAEVEHNGMRASIVVNPY